MILVTENIGKNGVFPQSLASEIIPIAIPVTGGCNLNTASIKANDPAQ